MISKMASSRNSKLFSMYDTIKFNVQQWYCFEVRLIRYFLYQIIIIHISISWAG